MAYPSDNELMEYVLSIIEIDEDGEPYADIPRSVHSPPIPEHIVQAAFSKWYSINL